MYLLFDPLILNLRFDFRSRFIELGVEPSFWNVSRDFEDFQRPNRVSHGRDRLFAIVRTARVLKMRICLRFGRGTRARVWFNEGARRACSKYQARSEISRNFSCVSLLYQWRLRATILILLTNAIVLSTILILSAKKIEATQKFVKHRRKHYILCNFSVSR